MSGMAGDQDYLVTLIRENVAQAATIDRLTAALRPFAVARASIENIAASMGAEPIPFPGAENRPITPPDGSGQTALAVFLDAGGDLSAASSEETGDVI